MPVYQIFIINRAGSLIYSWDGAGAGAEVEKTLSFPLEFRLAYVDQKATVTFGQRDGVRVGQVLLAVDGTPVPVAGRIRRPADAATADAAAAEDAEVDVLEWLASRTPAHPPVSLRFGRLGLSANEKIILSSMFHSLHTIGANLSPLGGSSGIREVETATFRLQCFQTLTGPKFVVVAEAGGGPMDVFLRRLYELYADFALKNPFYNLDMPIRCSKFDEAIDVLLTRYEKGVTLI